MVFNEEEKRDTSCIDYVVKVRRRGSYYLLNVFAMVYFLNILSWWQFLIHLDTLNDRLQICITCFVALVAFNFVVVEALPRISHSTYLTHFLPLITRLLLSPLLSRAFRSWLTAFFQQTDLSLLKSLIGLLWA